MFKLNFPYFEVPACRICGKEYIVMTRHSLINIKMVKGVIQLISVIPTAVATAHAEDFTKNNIK